MDFWVSRFSLARFSLVRFTFVHSSLVLASLVLGLLAILLSGCTKTLPTLTAVESVQLTDALVLHAQLSQNNQRAFLLTKGPEFSVWDIARKRPLQSIDANQGAESLARNTRKFAVSSDETQLLTSDGRSLKLWRLSDLRHLGSLDFSQQLGDANITSLTFIKNNLFVAGNSDGSIIFADIVNNVFRRSQFHSNEVVTLVVGQDKRRLYSAGNDGKVVVMDLSQYQQQQEFSAPFRITSLISNSDNSLLFISDALERQVFWQPLQSMTHKEGKVLNELDYWQQYRFFRLGLFINNDQQLVTTSPKTEVSLWNTQTGEELASWQAMSHSLGSTIMDIHPLDSNRLITLTSDAEVETWDLRLLAPPE